MTGGVERSHDGPYEDGTRLTYTHSRGREGCRILQGGGLSCVPDERVKEFQK